MTGDLDQQRIVKGRNDRSGVTHAAVQSHPVAATGTVGEDFSVVGSEFVFRIFGGDAALYRVADARDFLLRGQIDFFPAQMASLCQQYLGTNQVHAGNDFRDGVLHLNAGIDLNKIPAMVVEVVEKFHRAGVVIFDLLAKLDRGGAEFLAHLHVEVDTGGDLNDLLVAALN